MTVDPRKVAIAESECGIVYPMSAPYDPSDCYPEFKERVPLSIEQNSVYPLCRQLFLDLGLDIDNANTANWNPLGDIINPGDKVLLKPNLVRHIHLKGGVYEAVVTHGSVTRCLLDYVALALNGRGEIVVGDAPIQSADFEKSIELTGLKQVCEQISNIWGLPIRLVDFRLWKVSLDENHCIVDGQTQAGDASGYIAVDLGKNSLLDPLSMQHERFRVTSYDCSEMPKHHNRDVNEYLIPKTVLDSDVVINLPKLKTHRKVGLTASLKNLVGINGHKDWLPHHRCDSVAEGGDEYLNKSTLKKLAYRLERKMNMSNGWLNLFNRLTFRCVRRLLKLQEKDSYEEGSWYGNDTLWRTVLDLNRLLIYADKKGFMTETPQRKCLTIVDGIIAGEGEGPMEPEARHCNVLIGGINQVAIDSVLATMVGFDYRKIPIIINGFSTVKWPLSTFSPNDIVICSSTDKWRDLLVGTTCNLFRFVPPSGWIGHIES